MVRTKLGAAACVALFSACGGTTSATHPTGGAGTAASPDAGDANPDGGVADTGAGDGGSSGTRDAGGVVRAPATSEGWTFYGTANGGPSRVAGVTADEGGNLWVAGGEEGLFLLEAGKTQLRKFTMDDGLHPYGAALDGKPITQTYLNVASVSGGPAGVVFAGYVGMQAPAGAYGCEDNWDGPAPDPNIYASGDADRVTLKGSGIEVVHYDISSGPNQVAAEPRGREKVCTVYRILYDATSKSVWFGGNHGYAWGDPNSSRVMEHAHPLLNGYVNDTTTEEYALTNEYFGLAVEPSGNLWVGGWFRSQYCPAGKNGSGFWTCESDGSKSDKQLDWWPDQAHTDSRPKQRVDDHVSGMALGSDGSLWIGSFTNGLAHRATDGTVSFTTKGLVDPVRVSSVAVDPLDGSVWVGAGNGGITRIDKDGNFVPYDAHAFGARASSEVPDIQVDRSGPARRILVAFKSGWIGVYDGK